VLFQEGRRFPVARILGVVPVHKRKNKRSIESHAPMRSRGNFQ
jgi:hypothetical protein